MTSTAGSPTPSGMTARRINVPPSSRTAGRSEIGAGLARLQAVAHEHDVELLHAADEAEKHGIERATRASPTSRSSWVATGRYCVR